jgi:hypothetical protein
MAPRRRGRLDFHRGPAVPRRRTRRWSSRAARCVASRDIEQLGDRVRHASPRRAPWGQVVDGVGGDPTRQVAHTVGAGVARNAWGVAGCRSRRHPSMGRRADDRPELRPRIPLPRRSHRACDDPRRTATPAAPRRRPDAGAGPGSHPAPRRGVCGVPHRPSRRRRRAPGCGIPRHPGTRDCRLGGRGGSGRGALRFRRTRRRAVARLDVRHVPNLPRGT